jgi:hypothetical protein
MYFIKLVSEQVCQHPKWMLGVLEVALDYPDFSFE